MTTAAGPVPDGTVPGRPAPDTFTLEGGDGEGIIRDLPDEGFFLADGPRSTPCKIFNSGRVIGQTIPNHVRGT